MNIPPEHDNHVPWKMYLVTTLESLLAFYLATFCLAVFFANRGVNWLVPGVLLGLLYAFVVGVCFWRVVRKLSIAALMIVIPIAPLLGLFVVISLIPVLQKL